MMRWYRDLRKRFYESKILGNGFFGQKWPFKFILMQQTISENVLNNLLDTLNVSCLISTNKVKILIDRKNSQVTKAFNS